MNRRVVIAFSIVLILCYGALPSAARAQTTQPSTKQCVANALDRTIHLCDQGGSHLPDSALIRAYAKSSAGITSFQLWMDGVKIGDTATLKDKASMFTLAGTNNGVNAPGAWHRFVFVARDSVGEFRKAVYYFLGNSIGSAVPCPPTAGAGIKLCNLNDGATVTSPISISSVANSPSELIHNFGVTSEDSTNGGGDGTFSGDANVVGGTATLHLPHGSHILKFTAGLENGAIVKTVTINVR